MVIWNILRPFGISYDHFVYFQVSWYIFSRFGMLYYEKSGNPASRCRSLEFVMASSFHIARAPGLLQRPGPEGERQLQGDQGRLLQVLRSSLFRYKMYSYKRFEWHLQILRLWLTMLKFTTPRVALYILKEKKIHTLKNVLFHHNAGVAVLQKFRSRRIGSWCPNSTKQSFPFF
jgi:hypothetical protein